MSGRAVDHFTVEVERVMKRFRKEYKMSYAEMVGTLEIIKAGVLHEMFVEVVEEEETDE